MDVGITMYILSISSISEVKMVNIIINIHVMKFNKKKLFTTSVYNYSFKLITANFSKGILNLNKKLNFIYNIFILYLQNSILICNIMHEFHNFS